MLKCCKTMISEVHHVLLIQRQILLRPPLKHIAAQLPAVLLQLLARAKETGVARPVEESLLELHPPRVLFGRGGGRLLHKHWHAPVDVLGELGVDFGAEDRAGLGVRVDERDLVAREREAAALVGEVLDHVREEHELRSGRQSGGLCVGRGCAEREAGEFVTAMHAFEDRCGILKIKQARQRRAVHKILEKELGGVVRRNTAGNDAAHASNRRDSIAHRFSENRVKIDLASTT